MDINEPNQVVVKVDCRCFRQQMPLHPDCCNSGEIYPDDAYIHNVTDPRNGFFYVVFVASKSFTSREAGEEWPIRRHLTLPLLKSAIKKAEALGISIQ